MQRKWTNEEVTPFWDPCCQGISAFQLGAFQGRTPFIKSLIGVESSTVGGFIVSYRVDDERQFIPASVTAEFVQYEEMEGDY